MVNAANQEEMARINYDKVVRKRLNDPRLDYAKSSLYHKKVETSGSEDSSDVNVSNLSDDSDSDDAVSSRIDSEVVH